MVDLVDLWVLEVLKVVGGGEVLVVDVVVGGGGSDDVVVGLGGGTDVDVAGSARLGSTVANWALLLRLIALPARGLLLELAKRPWMAPRAHISGPSPVLPSNLASYHLSPHIVPVEPPEQEAAAALTVGCM